MGQLRKPLIGKRGGLFSYFCRHSFIIRRKLCWVKKTIVTRERFFLDWLGVFVLEIHYLFLIPYLYMYCSLDSNQHPSDLKWRKKFRILRGFELLICIPCCYHWAISAWNISCDFSCLASPETTLVKFVVWFYFSFFRTCSNFLHITSFRSWVVRVVDCRFEGCRFKSLQNFSCDS